MLPLFLGLVAAADDAAWKTKQIPDWSANDAKDLLTDSPWVKTFTPTMTQTQDGGGGPGGGMRRGMGGISIGIPGMGGMGRRGGGYPGGGQSRRTETNEPPKVTLRW